MEVDLLYLVKNINALDFSHSMMRYSMREFTMKLKDGKVNEDQFIKSSDYFSRLIEEHDRKFEKFNNTLKLLVETVLKEHKQEIVDHALEELKYQRSHHTEFFEGLKSYLEEKMEAGELTLGK